MMEGRPQDDPDNKLTFNRRGNLRTESQRQAYYRNHWRRQQMSDHLPMWLELKIDYGPIEIVDIPGFGFMSGQSKTMIEETKVNIITKLESWSNRLALSILIVDISLFRELFERWSSRGEIPIDVEFYGFLSEISQHVIVMANKSDKVKKRNLSDELLFLKEKLRDVVPTIEPKVIVASALKKQGMRELIDSIDNLLRGQGVEPPLWAFTASS